MMCCLKNEQETYEYLNSKLPNVGEKLKTKDGVVGEVQRVDVLRQKVKLIVEDENGDKEIQEYKIDDLLMRKKKPQGCQGCSKGCNNKNQGCNKGLMILGSMVIRSSRKNRDFVLEWMRFFYQILHKLRMVGEF